MMPTFSLLSAKQTPGGITARPLNHRHTSVQCNPIIADVFNRTGLIEKWGRGTNRVIDMCREAGIAPPTFEEITGAAVVTFRVNVLGAGREVVSIGERPGLLTQSPTQSATQSSEPRCYGPAEAVLAGWRRVQRAADKHGVQYAMELSGQSSERYIWRYVQPSQAQKEAALDGLF